jgi:RNA polymerase sigma factor (TIGR02999 family)
VQDNDRKPIADWVDLLYTELKLIAKRQKRGDRSATLNPTALLHEAFIRMERDGNEELPEAEFLRYISIAMRRLLVEAARQRHAVKRTVVEMPGETRPTPIEETLSLYLALDELEAQYRDPATVATLHKIAGLTHQEIAERMNLPYDKVREDWTFAKTWLKTRLKTKLKAAAHHA